MKYLNHLIKIQTSVLTGKLDNDNNNNNKLHHIVGHQR